MFTGLIEGTGTLRRIDRHGTDARMVIQANFPVGEFILGESIALDGACLTVTSFQGDSFTVDVSGETLNCTTLGSKSIGNRLNLERALRMGDRLGGHLVSGHIDAIGHLYDRQRDGRSWRLFFEIAAEFSHHMIEKGSVTVNGVSLTINGCGEGRFDVNIIPHTGQETTLLDLQIGDAVNIETDLIGKYIEKMLKTWKGPSADLRSTSSIDAAFLEKHGFL
jgi:riboflavin synthase